MQTIDTCHKLYWNLDFGSDLTSEALIGTHCPLCFLKWLR